MDEFRDGDERPWSSPETPRRKPEGSGAPRLEEVGDLHYRAAAYSSAIEYYRAALRGLVPESGPAGISVEPLAVLHRKLADCLLQQGRLEECAAQLDAAADLLAGSTPQLQAPVQVRRALLLYRMARYEEAAELARDAFATLATTDAHVEVGNAQTILGGCWFRLGRAEKAEEFYQDALATYRRIEHVTGQAQVLSNLALLAKNACRWSRAIQLFDRAEELMRAVGSAHELGALHLNKAVLYRKMGRRADALACVLRGSEMARSLGDQGLITKLRLLHAQLQIEEGKFADAERNLLEARVLAERNGSLRETALADEFLGDLMAARGRFDEAELNYGIAETRAREISGGNDVLAEVLRRQAQLALQRGDALAATQLAAAGTAVGRGCGEQYELGFLERVRGQALLACGRVEEAGSALQEALNRFRAYRLPVEIGVTLELLADLHVQHGGRTQLLAARGLLREAVDLAAADADTAPCRLQLALARVELELGNHDEALLALFEVERMSCLGVEGVTGDIEELRARIEAAMSSHARVATTRYQELANLGDPLLQGGEGLAQSASAMLSAVMERMGGERGLVALRGPGGRVQLVAASRMARARARRTAAHVLSQLPSCAACDGPRVWTRPQAEPAWREALGVDIGEVSVAVAFPLRAGEGLRGIVYFERTGEPQPLSSEALAVASTYVNLLRPALLDTATALDAPAASAPSPRSEEAFKDILTHSDKILEVLELCAKVADSPYTVLFTGETGTGKGLFARAVHELSARRDRTFLTVNCAAIPDTLLESELFGYVRGAFTGADRDKPGLIVGTERGTLFLDEVGKMSLPMQAKLLHFLDTKLVRPVGGTVERAVDVRILCASKQDLRAMVERDEFLEDLYYRMLDFPVHVPPLRERPEDVLLLAEHFIAQTCAELGRPLPTMTRSFAECLRAYAWPGNVRELEKAIRRTVILAAGELQLRMVHLPPRLREDALGSEAEDGASSEAGGPLPLRAQVAELERRVLAEALAITGWNRAEVSRRLCISYPTLLQKIKLYGLHAPA